MYPERATCCRTTCIRQHICIRMQVVLRGLLPGVNAALGSLLYRIRLGDRVAGLSYTRDYTQVGALQFS